MSSKRHFGTLHQSTQLWSKKLSVTRPGAGSSRCSIRVHLHHTFTASLIRLLKKIKIFFFFVEPHPKVEGRPAHPRTRSEQQPHTKGCCPLRQMFWETVWFNWIVRFDSLGRLASLEVLVLRTTATPKLWNCSCRLNITGWNSLWAVENYRCGIQFCGRLESAIWA